MLIFQTHDLKHSIFFKKNHEVQFSFNQILNDEIKKN